MRSSALSIGRLPGVFALNCLSLCSLSLGWLPGTANAAPPATVLEHHLDVRIDGSKRLTEEITWTVRIDDPEACSAGLLAPTGLDGAADSGALVLEDVLVVPSDVSAGATFTLRSQRRGDRGSHSGGFVSAPDLPVEHASVTVSAPSWIPLTVWADPGAVPDFDVGRSRRVVMSWTDVPPGQPAEAAWSSFEDWFGAGSEVDEAVQGLMADKVTLGRDLGADLEGLGVAGVMERAWQHLDWDQGSYGDWTTARSASVLTRERSGSAVDRGILLMSMLHVAGIQARPGYFRPATTYGSFPITVPAPALLPRPVVIVERDGRRIYIDPAADRTAVPDRPASMLGATVWAPGELPERLAEQGFVDGRVDLNANLTVSGDGSATWRTSIQATGAAREYLRELLAPLDEAGRTEALSRLARAARPGLERVQVDVSGAENPTKPLKLQISGHDDTAMQVVGYGMRGTITPTMGPALAAWLPPNLAVREVLSITPPPAVQILGSALADSEYRPEAVVQRSLSRQGPRAVLTVGVQRPYRKTSPSTDSAAREFLEAESARGLELLLFTPADRTVVKALRASPELNPAERAVLEAQLWWVEDNDRKARKALEASIETVGFEPLVTGLERFAVPGDLRPWQALSRLATEAEQVGWQMQVVEGMERAGLLRQAWLGAAALLDAPDADVRVRAHLTAERLQGPRPDPALDPDGAAAWQAPLGLLIEAQKAANEANAGQPDPRVVYRLAELSLAEGDRAGAETLLEGIVGDQPTALAEAMLALAAAMSAVPMDEVRARIESAVERDPTDAEVVSIAARALSLVGAHHDALEYALTAARLGTRDPARWAAASDAALAAGDLPTAVFAAQQASDLDLENSTRADRWASLAFLALDREAVDEARLRAGEPPVATWPPSIDDRMSAGPPEALLALLQHDDATVEGEPRLLAMRAQLRVETGLLDLAARDGLLLATRHSDPQGWALAFAATAGRQYSTAAGKALDEAARTELTAQMTRMDHALITGSGDPLTDARRLADDPRAEALLRVVSDPAGAAAEIEGWPAELPDPKGGTPRGYRRNSVLSAVPGVTGYSNKEAAVAIVRVGTATGLLPPPLGLLYSANPQAVKRIEPNGQVLRLDGGVMPLYAAVAVHEGQDVYGLGFTVAGATLALADALAQP